MDNTKLARLLDALQELQTRYPDTAELTRNPVTLASVSHCSGHDSDLCRSVLSFCMPVLRPQPEPDLFLTDLREKLNNNLFPDAEHPAAELTRSEQIFLTVLEVFLNTREGEFDPVTDVIRFDEEELKTSRVREEYLRFRKELAMSHAMALMRLSRETGTYNLEGHVIGVHNVALHTGILAKKAGLHVDLPLLSAAALGHDIGKYGCRAGDSARVPYLHYYYTYQWFTDHGMDEIGYISANHSTWDLEFENLPMESLLLIYADYRVRGHRNANGREIIDICTLKDAYQIIYSKLANMTEEKIRRYRTVYEKLRDFELLLAEHGVSDDLRINDLQAPDTRNPALKNAHDSLQGLCSMALTGSIELMRTVSTNRSFSMLLEQANNGKTMHSIRTYLNLFREFSTYMSKQNKKSLLVLLYDLLLHPDGDVRREAGEIMGEILANSGPKYRKERPGSAQTNVTTPAMAALLDESVDLWRQYIELCLHPDRKNSPRHARRISNSLKTITHALFRSCEAKDADSMLQPLLDAFFTLDGADWFALVDSLSNVPAEYLEPHADAVFSRLEQVLADPSEHLRLLSLNCLQHLALRESLRERACSLAAACSMKGVESDFALRYMQARILGNSMPELNSSEISALYLSNLKNAVHWTVKIAQVGLLREDALRNPENVFHTALHFSNMLCVSEHLPVRESAGERLLEIAPCLTVDQINEIAFDLLRELENGSAQIIRFIPPYIGRLLCLLPEKELCEAVDYLENMVRAGSSHNARVALSTLAEIVVSGRNLPGVPDSRILGILMTGISHYDAAVHETALRELCGNVFGSGRLSLIRRGELFCLLHKKLLTVLSEERSNQLSFFNRAAMMNHLYRFIVEYLTVVGDFPFAPEKPAAFFPGTFDPFSVGHKQIVESIRALGFEVYLAVDEFSWSKKTLPKLLRRQIVSISVSDQWDTYIFPDDIPVNIAMPEDLALLRSLLAGKELYLVAGSDVIRNASAYRNGRPGSAAEYNHVIFSRGEEPEKIREEFSKIISGKLQVLALPAFYETVSSTRIREYVDRKLDISMLVDPVVQSYIYANGLYIRSPESKTVLTGRELRWRNFSEADPAQPENMRAAMERMPDALGVLLTARENTVVGWAVGRTVRDEQLFEVLHSFEAAGAVRRLTSGRILMIDRVTVENGNSTEPIRMLLNELLVRSLGTDHTYGLCVCHPEDYAMRSALDQLGFAPVENCSDIFCVDMRSPVMLLQDALLSIKQPHQDDETVKAAVMKTRPRLRTALNRMFPGQLLLCFDSEQLNQALMERICRLNGTDSLPEGVRLGPNMCVPYGKILSDVVVPHTVTKTLHVEKCFAADVQSFDFIEYPGYSPLRNQVRTLKSFRRPVLLVDDLLHNGYRIEKLDKTFRQEGFVPEKIVVAIMSGLGRDLMRVQNRQVECEYYIPNLHYWVTESLLYPFIGGDSIAEHAMQEHMLPSVNLILPYYYPSYLRDADDADIRNYSRVSLENALTILQALEQTHQRLFDTALTLRRIGEALEQPRLPEQGSCMAYDFNLPASAYLQDALRQLNRISRREHRK